MIKLLCGKVECVIPSVCWNYAFFFFMYPEETAVRDSCDCRQQSGCSDRHRNKRKRSLIMNEQYCNQCENRCSVDALRCNRGRAYFGQEMTEPEMPAGAAGLLQKCGHVLHHGGIEPEGALSVLTAEEQAELERLLSILLSDWKKRMPEGAVKHHHGHH